MAVALIVVTAATYAAVSSTLPAWIGALAGVNLATVLLYGYDKAVSGGTKLRVPENVLHLLAFLGAVVPAHVLADRRAAADRRGHGLVVGPASPLGELATEPSEKNSVGFVGSVANQRESLF